MYLRSVAIGWVAGAMLLWMLVLPFVLLVAAIYQLSKRRFPRVATLGAALKFLLFVAFLNESVVNFGD